MKFTARCDLEVEEKITLPPFYRIEAQLLYYENVDGTIGSGQRCDIYSKCDPVFYGFLDLYVKCYQAALLDQKEQTELILV